jgi:hypothetical protein
MTTLKLPSDLLRLESTSRRDCLCPRPRPRCCQSPRSQTPAKRNLCKTMNNETKHTPGPWEVEGLAWRGKTVLNIRAALRFEICRMTDSNGLAASFSEQRANAALIAAAPELLEACKQSIITLDPMDNDHVELYRVLRAAIAKAEQNP